MNPKQTQNRITHTATSIAIALLVLLITLTPAKSYAVTEEEIADKNDEQLESEGWETIQKSTFRASIKCGLWSILVSTVWRGWGHRCANDHDSHKKFLIIEAASVAMIATALTISSLSRDDKYLSPLWKTLFHLGTSMFTASYLFDVAGTFKGSETKLARNHLNPHGFGTELALRWTPASTLNLGMQLDLYFRAKRFWVNPSAYIDVVDSSNWNTQIDTGVAVWIAENPGTYLAIAVQAKFDSFTKDKYYTLTSIPYIEFSLDLGTLFPHLENIRYVNRLGFGVEFFQFAHANNKNKFADSSTILVLESEISANLFKDLNLRLISRQRPDLLLGPISAPTLWFNTIPVPGVGLFGVHLNFNIRNNWFAGLQLNFGTNADFWISLAKHF